MNYDDNVLTLAEGYLRILMEEANEILWKFILNNNEIALLTYDLLNN